MAEKSGTGRCLGIQMDIVASSASQRGDRNSSKGSQKFTRVDEKLLAKVPQPVSGNLASRGGSSGVPAWMMNSEAQTSHSSQATNDI